MSESYVITESPSPRLGKTDAPAQPGNPRFTPLRSNIVPRDRTPATSREETLSQLVPVRRRQN
ncbi:hypothetical protein [Methyloceanibacter sp.]|uniref:hypothetical protein n=1 Tax=Methyloceanibacter sp. TaxID=1965321 RepID=UPI00208CF568|nr:hypothetical protein [Methyloceanibacter sp.]GFO80903.1 MAG: hypothetical protein A49_05300 [Methyloceanibacter sp.]HML90864.1 hypothetical protein [Methyloceanibacter sp.]